MADRTKADNCVTEAIATAHDRNVDMLDLGKAMIEAGALLVQFERNKPGATLLDSCRWALESEAN